MNTMQDKEIDHILNNFENLVNFTNCNAEFLAKLVEADIISLHETEEIMVLPTRLDKAFKFYQIVTTKAHSYNPLLRTLDETRQSGAAEILRKIENVPRCYVSVKRRLNRFWSCSSANSVYSAINPISAPVLFGVLPPVQLFTGRENELLQIHNKLKNIQKNSSRVITQTVSITGLGGIGKTELCRAYIQAHVPHHYQHVVWLLADSEINLTKSFKRLAKDYLKISLKDVDGGEKNTETIVDEVYNSLSQSNSLFVLDNAESSSCLTKFMPFRVTKKPFILITSRDREWEFEVDVLPLDTLSEEDAIQFVKRGLNVQNNLYNKDFLLLVKKLQCFPLALHQAISFITQQQLVRPYNVTNYIANYEKSEKDRKTQLSTNIRGASLNTYTLTTFTTWDITMKVISADKKFGCAARTILYIIAYLRAEKIPTNLLLHAIQYSKSSTWNFLNSINLSERFYGKFDPEQELEGALLLLIKYSMINSQPYQKTISIHRLVQDVTKIQLCDDKLEMDMLMKTLVILNTDESELSLHHIIHVHNYAKKYLDVINSCPNLRRKIVYKLFQSKRCGNYCGKQLNLLMRCLGLDHMEIMRTELFIVTIRNISQIFVKVIANRKNVHEMIKNKTDSHFSIDETINHGVSLVEEAFQKMMKFSQIVKGHSKIQCASRNGWNYNIHIEILKKLLLPEIIDIFPTDENMLDVKTHFQNNAELELKYKLFNESLEKLVDMVYKHEMNLLALDTAYSSECDDWNVSRSRHAKKVETTCFEIGEIAYKQSKLILGGNHVDTIEILNLSGKVYSDFGKFEKALETHLEAYSKYKQLLGEHHCCTLAAKCDVALTLSKIGRNEEALECLKDVLQLESETLGSEHDEIWYTKFFMAEVLRNMERYENAESLLCEVENKFSQLYGETSFQCMLVEETSRGVTREIE